MNKARTQHNSCIMGNYLYVCGGKNEDAKDEITMEKLLLDKTGTAQAESWEILEIEHKIETNFLMIPFNDNEILLLRSPVDSVRINFNEVIEVNEGAEEPKEPKEPKEPAFDHLQFNNSFYRFVENQSRLSYDKKEVLTFASAKPANLHSLITLSKVDIRMTTVPFKELK